MEEKIYQYISDGNVEKCKQYIEMGANVNNLVHGRKLLLNLAVIHDRIECIKILLEAGVNPNLRDDFEYTAIHLARSVDAIKLLLQHNADIHIKTNDGCTVLHSMAAWGNSNKCIEYFIEQGLDINETDMGGNTPLHTALFRNNIECVKFLIDNGANTEIKNNRGYTIGEYATLCGLDDISYFIQSYKFKNIKSSKYILS